MRAYSGIPEQGPLDEATAKLMIHGYYASVSFVDAQIVEFVDLYPTMCDAARIEQPAQLEGTSLLPLLKSPDAKTKLLKNRGANYNR